MIVGIDIDGVLADTVGHLLASFPDDYPIAYDEINRYDFVADGHPIGEDIIAAQHDNGFVMRTPVHHGALHMVKDLQRAGWQIHYITARPKASEAATIQWLELHGFPRADEMLVVEHGAKHEIEWLDALVEDHAESVDRFAATGRQAILVTRPWNAGHIFPTHAVAYCVRAPSLDHVARALRPAAVSVPVLNGLNYDEGKPRVDLIPGAALTEIGRVLEMGCGKYAADNWRSGTEWRRQYGSLIRHALAWIDGEDLDAESGLHHMAHVATRAIFLLDFASREAGIDDRFRSPN